MYCLVGGGGESSASCVPIHWGWREGKGGKAYVSPAYRPGRYPHCS